MNRTDALAARKAAARGQVEARIADSVKDAPPLPFALERRLRELIVLAQNDQFTRDRERQQCSSTSPPASSNSDTTSAGAT
jgi:hypothetical protein